MEEKSSRTLRQEECVRNWVKAKCKGTCECAVGFGKTRIGMLAISKFIEKNKDANVIIVVPSEPIQRQWIDETIAWNVFSNCSVKTMHDTSSHNYNCDLLVIDEIHKVGADKLITLFDNIKYKIILGLTATFERLDGKHKIIEKKCPIIDTVTPEECIKNGWMAKYREYLVLIDVDDIDNYAKVNQEFNDYFSAFNYDFKTAMACATDWKARVNLAKSVCSEQHKDFKEINKIITINAMGFNRTLQARKKFIYNHPKKIELANLILEHRSDKKCITFSNTVSMAEKIKYGSVYSGKDSVKKGRITLSEFVNSPTGVLNTVLKVREGFNDPSLSVIINLGINSSKAINIQKRGRATRVSDDKEAEIFYLVIRNTVEEKWFSDCIGNDNYITIDENSLVDLLEGKDYTIKKNKKTSMLFRF